jgi:hypothetical protein
VALKYDARAPATGGSAVHLSRLVIATVATACLLAVAALRLPGGGAR